MKNENHNQPLSTQCVPITAPATAPTTPAPPTAPPPPVLLGWVDRAAELVRVWCPHCRRYHTHGAPGGELARHEHRAAHCCDRPGRPASPYHATGYMIRTDHRQPPPAGPGWRGRAAWWRRHQAHDHHPAPQPANPPKK